MIPIIETARLCLRPRTMSDLDDYPAMDTDPVVTKFIWGEPPDPAERRAELEKRFRADRTTPGGN